MSHESYGGRYEPPQTPEEYQRKWLHGQYEKWVEELNLSEVEYERRNATLWLEFLLAREGDGSTVYREAVEFEVRHGPSMMMLLQQAGDSEQVGRFRKMYDTKLLEKWRTMTGDSDT